MKRIQRSVSLEKTVQIFQPAAAGVMLATAIMLAPALADDGNKNLGPGCDPSRPAVLHKAGGINTSGPPGQRPPIPCAVNTGFRSSETAIVVSNDGALVVMPEEPASGFPIGVARSADDGATWNAFLPAKPDSPPRITPVDNNMTIDRDTGRIFWVVGTPGGTTQMPRLDMSDDGGRTWFGTKNPGTIAPEDHSQIWTGPPPKFLKPAMQSYPNVVYLCQGNLPVVCQRSVDGGNSFSAEVVLPVPPEAGIGCRYWGQQGAVAKDGTLYVPSTPCVRPYVAISRDAGQTFQQVLVANTNTIGFGALSLGIDKQGNLYTSWVGLADRLPYLAISRDGGQTWSNPLMIAAPGVNEAAIPQLVAGKRGHVAVVYYGSKNAPQPFPPICAGSPLSTSCPGYQNETWDTYITETWNALDQSPQFWSAPLNNPKTPTWYGCSPAAFSPGGGPPPTNSGCLGSSQAGPPYWGRMDYFGITMDDNETVWAAFNQECPDGLPFPGVPSNCSGAKGQPQDSLWSMVGHLVQSKGNGIGED